LPTWTGRGFENRHAINTNVVRKPSGQFAIDKQDKNKIMLTDQDLTEIADRCNKATGGPWKSFIEGCDHESGSDFIQTPDGDIELIGGTRDDQDFIAHSRTDIPKLIEEIKRLKAK